MSLRRRAPGAHARWVRVIQSGCGVRDSSSCSKRAKRLRYRASGLHALWIRVTQFECGFQDSCSYFKRGCDWLLERAKIFSWLEEQELRAQLECAHANLARRATPLDWAAESL